MTEISPSNRTRKYFWEVQGAVFCKAAAIASSFLDSEYDLLSGPLPDGTCTLILTTVVVLI